MYISATTLFDLFVQNNYKQLRSNAKKACNNDHAYEDILHEKLINLRNRIFVKGLNSKNKLENFVSKSVRNEYLKIKRLQKNNLLTIENYDFEHVNDSQEIEQKHLNNEEKVKHIFNYLSLYYPPQQCSLFEIYYMTNLNTYKKIVQHNNYSFRYIKNLISNIKKDLKLNLDDYIKSQRFPENQVFKRKEIKK